MNAYTHEPTQTPKYSMIWMHGLGADARDMMGLAAQLPTEYPIRHVFMEAPQRPVTIYNGMSARAWYDITGMELTHREDEQGILQSEHLIQAQIEAQHRAGIAYENIFLAGFSQGAAMALLTGIRSKCSLGGVIALSGYLPLAAQQTVTHRFPVFVGLGTADQIVWPQWTRDSVTWLKQQQFTAVSVHEYPMEHSVCTQEIHDLNSWLKQQMPFSQEIAHDGR